METKTKSKSTTKDQIVLKVLNSEIVIGETYILDGKPDPTAPNGMRELGSTKYPFENNISKEAVFLDEERGRFDTGFYEESLCVNIVDTSDVKERVASYVKHIKTPYEKMFNKDLNPNEDNEFWVNYRVNVFENRAFDTSKIQDLLDLFIVITQTIACEKDEKSPRIRTRDTFFTLTSPRRLKNKVKDNTKLRRDTVLSFNTLLESEREKLDLVLQWAGRENTSKIDKEDLEVIYYDVINHKEDGIVFCNKFNDALQEYSTEKGKEKMEYFYMIKKLESSRVIKKTPKGLFTKDDIFLANTSQELASFCINYDSKQHNIVNTLIEENPSLKK